MKWALEDALARNRKLKFLLTHKLLFMRCFADVNILKNIIGYIAKYIENVFIEVKYCSMSNDTVGYVLLVSGHLNSGILYPGPYV